MQTSICTYLYILLMIHTIGVLTQISEFPKYICLVVLKYYLIHTHSVPKSFKKCGSEERTAVMCMYIYIYIYIMY